MLVALVPSDISPIGSWLTAETNEGEEGLESLLGTARVDNEAHGQAII